MYRYTEYIDAADFDAIGALFAHGRLTTKDVPGSVDGAQAVAALYRSTNRVQDNGTLRTRHLCVNPIVEIDEASDRASARSSFVVFQATDDLPLQPIVAGRYRDRFERVDGAWRFAEREMNVEQVGDVHEHLVIDLDRYTR
jgi:3-phenylpropionate/cinnamic acid dioxygenase small subunit